MQQIPQYYRFTLGAFLTGGIVFSAALIAAPIIDTTPPTIVSGIDTPKSFDATQAIVTPQLTPEITAADVVVNDGIDFHFVPDGRVGPLIPGQYTIEWTATDLGLNTDSATQIVNVLPTISLAPDQSVGEGGTALVTAYLSGTAPDTAYPVTINYTVTGSATNPDDHDAANGSFIFNAGETSSSISFTIASDLISDAGETVVITLGALPPGDVIAGAKLDQTVTISETNVAPLAQLHAAQGSNDPTRIVTSDGGMVTVSADTYDANGDTIFYDWSASDNALIPLTGTTGSTFSFDPLTLIDGNYRVRLTVSDTGGKSSTYEIILSLVDSGIFTLTDKNDTDDDKIDDAAEGYDDEDNDGIPDYLDANTNPALLQAFEPYVFDTGLKSADTLVTDSITLDWKISTTASNTILYQMMIATEPGLTLSLGPTAFAARKSYARMSTGDAELLVGVTIGGDRVSSDGQVMDIAIGNLSQAGDSVTVVLPQIAPIPPSSSGDPEFIIFSNIKTWETFTDDAANNIYTSDKSGDYCPGPNDAAYTGSLAASDECLQIRIKDGGPNDYDGVANGVIHLMGAVFITSGGLISTTAGDEGLFSGDTGAYSESLNKLDLGTGKGGGMIDTPSLIALILILLCHNYLNKPGRRQNDA